MVTDSRRTSRRAWPLKWPVFFASATVPRAVAHLAMTMVSPTATGSATVAVKVWPVWLPFELRVSPVRTIILVPSGMVISRGGAGAAAEDWPLLFGAAVEPAGALPAGAAFPPPPAAELSGVDDFEQPSAAIRASAGRIRMMRAVFIFTS